MTIQTLTGGEAVVESLVAHGVDTVFGIPGAQTYGLFDAFARASDRIRVVGPRHEQATAYMAFGYAKSTGRPGVFSVVPGPGVLNASAAICSAYGASTPVLCLTGQVPSAFIGSGKGHLHELPDQLATMRTLTKWAERVEHPGEAPRLMAEAFRQMRSGRPRPVSLEMPWDVFGMRAPMRAVAPSTEIGPPPVDEDRIAQAARLLVGAKNPMLMVGGGAQHAPEPIRRLAERLQAPVVAFRGGLGIVSPDHPLGFNCAEGYERWAGTDVVVGIGSRMELQWFRWPDRPADLKMVLIDIDPVQVPRLRPDIAIVADAREAVVALDAALEKLGVAATSRAAEFGAMRAAKRAEVAKLGLHVRHLAAIRDVLPRDGFLVEEICQTGFTSYFAFPVHEPRTFVTCGHQGTLGFGFPTALGVKVAHPDRAVVSITGDGGFMFGVQELATAVQHGIALVTVLFNNAAFGNVLRDQQRLYEGRLIGSELRNPDFVKLAESFGVAAERVATPETLRPALERALASNAPALIEVMVDRNDELSPWPFLMPASRRTGGAGVYP
jgi:acetolactate synthase-1/2/3 large subunit